MSGFVLFWPVLCVPALFVSCILVLVVVCVVPVTLFGFGWNWLVLFGLVCVLVCLLLHVCLSGLFLVWFRLIWLLWFSFVCPAIFCLDWCCCVWCVVLLLVVSCCVWFGWFVFVGFGVIRFGSDVSLLSVLVEVCFLLCVGLLLCLVFSFVVCGGLFRCVGVFSLLWLCWLVLFVLKVLCCCYVRLG